MVLGRSEIYRATVSNRDIDGSDLFGSHFEVAYPTRFKLADFLELRI